MFLLYMLSILQIYQKRKCYLEAKHNKFKWTWFGIANWLENGESAQKSEKKPRAHMNRPEKKDF